jgi:hypothetical protein
MRFETRSREAVLDDLTKKVGELPLNHPDRSALVRMIDGLRAEIGLPGDGKRGRTAGENGNAGGPRVERHT